MTRRRAQAFKGSRRALVTAAEPDAAPAAPAGRAPRANARALSSLQAGEVLEGKVVAVQAFGAFVDIGAESQGLIHVSQLMDGYVKNVADVIKVGDVVKAKVLSVDVESRRLALTRKGMGIRPARTASAAIEAEEEDEELEDELAADPNTAELDGLTFVVEDDDDEAEDVSTAEIEYVEELDPEVQREIAIAYEDIVNGTVTAVDADGVTVKYQLEDGTEVEGRIHVSELLAPSHLVEGADDADEAEAYAEVDDINPATYYKVGDAISAFVFDVEAGKPMLTQRLPEEADDELAELAQVMEEFQQPEDVPESLLIQGLWAAAEEEGEEEDEGENGDLLLEAVNPQEGAVAAADTAPDVDGVISAVPEELRAEVLASLTAKAPNWNRSLVGAQLMALNLPDRPVGIDPTVGVTSTLLDRYQADMEDEEESELVGVSSLDTSYVPRSLLKKMGYKIIKGEDSGEWEVARRGGTSDEAEDNEDLDEELASIIEGRHVSNHQIDAIVADVMADDDDEAEVPRFARRNPVVAAAAVANISAAEVKALRQKTGAGMMDCKKALAQCGGDAGKAVEWLRQKGLSGADKKAGRVAAEGAIVRYIHPGSRLGVLLEVNCETDFVAAGDKFTSLAGELAMVVASSEVVCVSVDDMPAEVLAKERKVEMGKEDLKSKPEAVRAKIVEGRLEKIKKNFSLLEQPSLRDNNKTVGELIKETIAATGENIRVRRFVKYNLGEGLERKSTDFAAEVAQQTQAKKEAAPAAAKEEEPRQEQQLKQGAAKPAMHVSAGLVKQLRDKSGAGMMDCKKALAENNGDIEAASEWLRKKGLASADKKAGRLTAEGAVVAYIHPGSRLGVLLEVNCETDFVAAGDVFNRLANTVAMQIAASTVEYVSSEEIPADIFEREKEIEMGREDLQAKPEAIRAKIAEGRVKKLVQERVLLEQPYLLDQNKTVAEAVKEAVAACGENIQIRRFVRFVLGEGVEKKESNLAAEVAAATGKA
eukprot:GHRR01013317.1.p1 GENE.GHRR01013317.1~~GHRR01013317.1.p1  ORF type:complete len:992 (+),score=471.36 GHRR01013317.1:234-3209(+)